MIKLYISNAGRLFMVYGKTVEVCEAHGGWSESFLAPDYIDDCSYITYIGSL